MDNSFLCSESECSLSCTPCSFIYLTYSAPTAWLSAGSNIQTLSEHCDVPFIASVTRGSGQTGLCKGMDQKELNSDLI